MNRPTEGQKTKMYELVKQSRRVTVEEFQTLTSVIFENCYGHRYSFCNSVFLYMQGVVQTYAYPEDIDRVVMAGRNQWLDQGKRIVEGEEPFFIWVPSINRKKAQHENKDISPDELKKHHFYLCPVWTEAQTEDAEDEF